MFSGYKNFKPVNYCEVEINFLNELEKNNTELNIKRYMSRGGINSYYINNVEVQKKQMTEILRPFGLGSTLFLIIDQGTVDKILNLNSDQLCQIFLESLGYGNYKAEKAELESKILEKEEQIETFNTELKKNKSKLEILYKDLKIYNIYIEISNKIDLLRKELVLREYDELIKKRLNTEKEQIDIKREYAKLLSYKKEVEDKYLKFKELNKNIESEMNAKNSILERINEEIHENEISLERLDGQIKLLESKLDLTIKNINSKKDKIKTINLINSENVQKLKNLKDLLPDMLKEKEPNEILQLLNIFEKNISEIEKNNSLLKELESKKITLNHFTNELSLNNTALKEISTKLCEKQRELSILEEQFNSNVMKLKNISKTLEKDQIFEEKRLNEKAELINYLTTKVSGILGFLEDLYNTEERYNIAVSVALGGFKRSLVLQSKSELNNLKNAAMKINKNLNVFVLDLVPNVFHHTIQEEILKKYNSKRLIELINFDSKLTKLFYNLIGNTLLLNSFEEAINLRNNESFWKFRLVTLDGEIFSTNGQIQLLEKNIKKPANLIEYKELKISTEGLNLKLQKLKENIQKLVLEQNSLNAQINIILREKERLEKEIKSLEITISNLNSTKTSFSQLDKDLYDLRENFQIVFELSKINERISTNEKKITTLNAELEDLENKVKEINKEIYTLKDEFQKKKKSKEESLNRKIFFEKEIKLLREQQIRYQETNFVVESSRLAQKESELLKKVFEIDNKMQSLNVKIEELINNNEFLKNINNTNIEMFKNKNYKDYSTEELQSTFSTLLKQRDELGPINFKVKENYEQLKEEIAEQETKIKSIKEILKESNLTIKSLDSHVNNELINSVQKINEKLGSYFKEIFNGNASLVSTKNPITNGIFLEIKIPGRKFLNMNMLSGGERAMISILLYVSLMENNQTPFCYFDEVDASLDEANLARFVNLLNILKEKKQLIVVTHQRITMEAADNLIGISKNMEGEISCITTKR
ncbi:condensin subunit Smc [Thermodesulfobium acidiphilum]|uniref:Condensin subunit Smc n=1 Tax=Thermodesulfobium acidiphilum TaxID=1794699 RepID=A0A2R4W086_THEAF|nr:condensin subunit Smc [Thermodesulfobium acidiphilum]